MSESTCRRCGVLFTPRSGGNPQVYCSARCRQAVEIERAKAKRQTEADRPATIVCEVCAKQVECKPVGRRPKYCSSACRIRANTPPERKREYNEAFKTRHPGYHANWQRKYREDDPERSRAACRRYYAKNVDNWDQYRQGRKDLLRPDDVAYTTWAKVAARFAMWNHRCWLCGAAAQARDHVKPLSKGGRHLPSNIRPICHSCNSRKRATWPFPLDTRWPDSSAA